MLGDDYSHLLLGVTWPFTCLSAVFVAGRFFCRRYCHSKIGWDDFWAAFSLVMSFAMSISWTVYARLGGTLDAPLPYSSTVKIIFISWLSQTWCITAIVTTKISIAALIKRLQAPSKWRTVVLWSLCSVSAAWALIQIGFVWGQCRPTATLWDPRGHSNGSCWSPTVVVYNGMACSSFWAFTDIALAFLPVHMVIKLRIALRRKIAICVLLSTGLLAAAMTIVRTTKLPADLQKNSDHVYQYVMFFIWNILEINALIMSSCIPTLVPLWDLARGRAGSKYKRRGRNTTSHKISNARYAHNAASVYINLESQTDEIGSDGGNDNTASVSVRKNMNHLKHGIHVSKEVNVSNAPAEGSDHSIRDGYT
ncbi:hypothetical protein G7Y79_00069g096570 [Physcia stellaris]|nr:hypothetical protein G7Y79_00069g096570 [Physcia stellaris]